VFKVRWLGRVRFNDAYAVQKALHDWSRDDYLLLLEHAHVYTMGVRAKEDHLLAQPAAFGAELVKTDRGGDITYHGPGQLVVYPVLSLPWKKGVVPEYVHGMEQVVIDTLDELGLHGAGRLEGYPGVWLDTDGERPRKICAIGVRISRGRTMHGLALNVDPDLSMFTHIVPCGISDKPVTSLAAEGVRVSMADVVEIFVRKAVDRWAKGQEVDCQYLQPIRGDRTMPPTSQNESSRGTDTAVAITRRKPPWLRAVMHMGPGYRAVDRTVKRLGLHTVCEEAGCPNIFECWGGGTATFMINGERCTRSCAFCMVDTAKPLPLDPKEPESVAEAVVRMGLNYAVVTSVARDDLPDGGASGFAATIRSIREKSPSTLVEVLVPDFKGDDRSLQVVFDARPDVFNHNLETVLALQRSVRPSASYARSLSVLARAKQVGLTTKSGLMVGLGESYEEVIGAISDLASVGVDILTVGQYLPPSAKHRPVSRWWHPDEFEQLKREAVSMGFSTVMAAPLVRSSYHAKETLWAVESM